MFSALNTSPDSNKPTNSLIEYAERIKALCAMSTGNLQQRCLHDNKHIVKRIYTFVDNNSDRATIEGSNDYLKKERKKGLDEYLAKPLELYHLYHMLKRFS